MKIEKKRYISIERTIPYLGGKEQVTIEFIRTAYDKVAIRRARKLETKFNKIQVRVGTLGGKIIYESEGFNDSGLYRINDQVFKKGK